MNYNEALDYLYNTLPMFSRMGSVALKKDLVNTRKLCDHLGHPQERFKIIHVGGTNGKGSVSHMLAAALQTAGYKTGLYTSPHLYDFRERFRINGEMIAKDRVLQFVEAHRALIEAVEPSFFEITVAMAFLFFADAQVDVAVIEVGLGGRLDSTNVVNPVLSVITNVGFDHMDVLGNTREAIAREKAGIIKKQTPVVVGEKHPETENIFWEGAASCQSPLVFAEDLFKIENHSWLDDQLQVAMHDIVANKDHILSSDLTGAYQLKNIVTSMAAARQAHTHFPNLEAALKKALPRVKKTTGMMGRWDVINHHPKLVLEVAHNKEGIETMLQHIGQLNFGKLHLVVGMVKDKDVNGVLTLLPKNASYYFSQASIPRALPAAELQNLAAGHGLMGASFTQVNDAVKSALENASEDDLVIVCGSIFLVAEVDRSKLQLSKFQ